MGASMTAEERDAFWRKNRRLADQIAKSGTPIFPCTPDKKPLVKSWPTAASTDDLKINNWWAGGKLYIPGVPTGKKAGFFVLDVDRPKDPGEPDGLDTLRELESKYGPLPETLRQRTPSGGIHYFFMMPEDGRDIRNSAGQIGPKLDIRGSGGYVCAYGWENNVEVANPPVWLINLIFAKKQATHAPVAPTAPPRPGGKLPPYIQAAIDGELDQAATAPKGSRNHTLNQAAFALGQWIGGRHLAHDEGFNMLMQAASTSGVLHDDGESQTRKTIDGGLRAGMGTPRHPPEPEKKAPAAKKTEPKADKPRGGDDAPTPTEDAIAAEFAAAYAGRLKFCEELGIWLEWNQERHIWQKDRTRRAFHYCRMVCRRMNTVEKTLLAKAVTAAGVERFARSDPALSTVSEQWDQGNMLIGTPAGARNTFLEESNDARPSLHDYEVNLCPGDTGAAPEMGCFY